MDQETGFNNVKYKLQSEVRLMIDEAPVKMLNVELECETKKTPWCDPSYTAQQENENFNKNGV